MVPTAIILSRQLAGLIHVVEATKSSWVVAATSSISSCCTNSDHMLNHASQGKRSCGDPRVVASSHIAQS